MTVTIVGEKYRIGRKIGEGSFGIIYEGLNLDTNEQVAVKFVRIALPFPLQSIRAHMSSCVNNHLPLCRSRASRRRRSFATSIRHTKSCKASVRLSLPLFPLYSSAYLAAI